MIKADIINQVSSKAGITKAAAEKVLTAFINGITAALKKGDKVSLVGFGSFRVRKRAARKGRNPQTGKEITIKAAKVPKFKAGKALKDVVNR
jgi:DNA-binding protein HU-beta